MRQPRLGTLGVLCVLGGGALSAQTLESVLSRMDEAAAQFQSLVAHLRSLKHTDIVKDDSVDEGTIWVKRVKPKVSRFLIEFTVPDKYYVAVTERRAEVYRPKIAQVEEYDVSRYRELVEQVWPFGASGRDLAARYKITLKGPDSAAGTPAMRLELIPKSQKLLEQLPRIEMWVSNTHWHPVQQKYYDVTPGDYRLFTYTDIKLNGAVSDAQIRLSPPPGVKRVRR
jgi:outer membrane lipoprotein-sorting protein